jgi:hypothetical protein
MVAGVVRDGAEPPCKPLLLGAALAHVGFCASYVVVVAVASIHNGSEYLIGKLTLVVQVVAYLSSRSVVNTINSIAVYTHAVRLPFGSHRHPRIPKLLPPIPYFEL